MEQLNSKAKKEIQKAVDTIEAEIKAARVQLPNLVASGNVQGVATLSQYINDLQAKLDGVKIKAVEGAAALGKVGNAAYHAGAAVQRGGGGFKSLGYGVLMVSQAVDDLPVRLLGDRQQHPGHRHGLRRRPRPGRRPVDRLGGDQSPDQELE
jgi:hypothetical protein